MVRTKSAAKRNESTPVKHFPGNDVPGEPLNLDVLSLIAVHAHPRDLLNLAHTSKYFQELLMDKSSALVWKTARGKFEGLPDCPADLTEQEYADLAFCARCHSCGQYTDNIFWEIRRRYCSHCRVERLYWLSSCHEIIQQKYVLGMQHLTIGKETPLWVDREQMESFMDEYKRSSDKQQLLSDRQEQLVAVRRHARQCENWQRGIESEFKIERDRIILERLKQLGYEPEIRFFGRDDIRESRKSPLDICKPLTDKEWDRVWPEWLETMNSFRLERLERTVYQTRRRSLVHEYDTYVTSPSPNTPSFDLLPHVADVARFPPFRDIIRASEETSVNDELFQSAFAQLPEFVDEWKKRLDTEVAELVQIPSDLSLNDASGDQVIASNSATSSRSPQAPTDKLRLACALFHGEIEGIFTYPEVFSTSMRLYRYPLDERGDAERIGSIWDRFGIKYIKEAPYIVHVCGLDPNVATAEDMDRRNARLKCLSLPCSNFTSSWSWRDAVWHWHASESGYGTRHARWELIGYDGMGKICAAEPSDTSPHLSRCLLCRPRVGDVSQHRQTLFHFLLHHEIGQNKRANVKRGVHYQPIAMQDWALASGWVSRF